MPRFQYSEVSPAIQASHMKRITQYFRGLREKLSACMSGSEPAVSFFKALAFYFIQCRR